MSDEFNKSVEELYNTLLSKAKTSISQRALANVNIACKALFGAKAPICYASVSKFLHDANNKDLFKKNTEKTVTPKYQSILNNKGLKQLIDFYSVELDRLTGKPTEPSSSNKGRRSGFPIETLDVKARTYVRMLELKVESLGVEVSTLSEQVKAASLKQPINLSLSYDASSHKGLPAIEVLPDKSNDQIDITNILRKVASLPDELPDFFEEKSRGDKTVLRTISASSGRVYFTSDEWKLIKKLAEGI